MNSKSRYLSFGAVVAAAIYVAINHFTWSVDGAEVILKNGDVYKGSLSNSGFGQYRIETAAGVVLINKNAVASTSW